MDQDTSQADPLVPLNVRIPLSISRRLRHYAVDTDKHIQVIVAEALNQVLPA